MRQENFSPEQSLIVIDSMINKAKNHFSENGFLYLLWGWVIFLCAVGHFLLLEFNVFKQPELIWTACWVVVIVQVVYLVKQKKKEKVRTYSDEVMGYLWISFGIALFLLGVILGKARLFEYIYPVFLVIYGIPTFLSGVIMRFNPLKAGGIACWVLSLISVFIVPGYTLLLLAVAVLVAWIIPGYLLKKKYQQQTN